GPARGKDEFHLRQIVGSANYACGNDVTDFLHGWLNYQIEHHLFPRATMLQYRRMQPELKTLCHKYGVPYVQESVWKRAWKTVDIMTGQTSMRQDYEYEEAAELSRAAG
ncbi:MAG: fatty acid desaturase, partial [Myxococcota bacterium]